LKTGIPGCLQDMVRGHAAIRDTRHPDGVVTAGSTRSSCRQLRWERSANTIQWSEPSPDTFDIRGTDALNVIGFPQW